VYKDLYARVKGLDAFPRDEWPDKADSSGRRNIIVVGLSEQVVKHLCRRFPIQRFTRPGIEGGRHGSNLLGAVHAQIRAFREVRAQQPVGIFVGATLPRAVRVAEIDLHAGVDLQACVLGHLSPLIPRQRPAELLRQGEDRARDGVTHGLGPVSGKRGSVLHASLMAMARHARQVQQQDEARCALHQGADHRPANRMIRCA